MAELLRDFLASSTLSGAITSGATSLVVASAANFPTSGTFDVRIDNEIVTVTAVSGTTFTITRAAGTPATTAAAHSDGATVKLVLTKRALDTLMATLVANNQTGTTYTLALTDAGLIVECNNAAAIALTIPANASVAFPVGTVIQVYQMGAGQVTVGITTDTLRSPNGAKTSKQYAVVSLWKQSSTVWVISGDTAA